jgi:hypothetical protein
MQAQGEAPGRDCHTGRYSQCAPHLHKQAVRRGAQADQLGPVHLKAELQYRLVALELGSPGVVQRGERSSLQSGSAPLGGMAAV